MTARSLVALAMIAAASATAQPRADVAPDGQTTTTTLPAVAITDVPARVEEIQTTLDRIETSVAVSPNVATIETRLPTLRRFIAERVARDRALLASGGGLVDIDVVLGRWRDEVALLRRWDDTLGARGTRVTEALRELDDLRALWSTTRDALRVAQTPADLLARVDGAIGTLATVQTRVEARRDAILTLRSQVARQRVVVDALIGDTERLQRELLTAVFRRDQPPLWRLWTTPKAIPFAERLRSMADRENDDLAEFLRSERDYGVRFALVALLGLMLGAIGLARRAKRWTTGDAPLARVSPIVARPISTGLVLWVILLPWLQVPIGVRRLGTLLLIGPVVRLLGPLLGTAAPVTAAYLVSLLVLDRLSDALAIVPEIARPIFLAEMVVGYLGAAWIAQLSSTPAFTSTEWVRAWVRRLSRVAQGMLVVAALADVLGFGQFARLIGDGTVVTGCGALAIWVIQRALDGLVSVVVRSWPLDRLRLVRREPQRASRHLRRVITLSLSALWGFAVLRLFRVLDLVLETTRAVLAFTLEVGEVAISVGSIVAFAVGVLLAVILSRTVRIVLEEEVFSRTVLPRGIPYAISTASGYAVLLLGVITAFAAAGIELGRLSIILGGLGVGVGFGLQEIVRDLVAGSVLLFERPLQIGDVVQMENVFGDVRRIGLRSSTIRTYEGAEIIVPNSALTSSRIINWTLSDRKRRVDVDVGVAYGTDPARVLGLLADTARAHPDLIAYPEPTALFTGFGDSSLDFQLRAWTDRSDQFAQVRSNVTVAVHAALTEAGITIPFPQRDVHVIGDSSGDR